MTTDFCTIVLQEKSAMKKIVFLLSLLFTTNCLQAQVEGEPNAVSLSENGNKTYVVLINQLFEKINPKNLGGGWRGAQMQWQNNQQNKNTIKQQALFLDLLATHLTTNSFLPTWTATQKQWKAEIKNCSSVSALSSLLLQFESALKEEAFTKDWKSQKSTWENDVQNKIEK
jgi:hypothetical protein